MATNQTFQRKEVYKDFDLNFTRNPLTNDIAVKKDANAISQSVRNLVNTYFYERAFHPEIGCNVRNLLFQPADAITIVDLRTAIEDTIRNFEPRVQIEQILIEDNSERNHYHVRLLYSTRLLTQPTEFEFILERLR